MKSYIFLADGFEEVEALATLDIMRRAAMDVELASVNPTAEVVGAHGLKVTADTLVSDIDLTLEVEWLVCPGGMPGASNLVANAKVRDMLMQHNEAGGRIAAICASPAVVLAPLGILRGQKATCYPGMRPDDPTSALWTDDMVVESNNVVTGRGPAASADFALAIVAQSRGAAVAQQVAEGMLLR